METVETTLDTTFKYAVFHRENQKWLESIAFYEHEIDYFSTSLQNAAAKAIPADLQSINQLVAQLKANKASFVKVLGDIQKEEWSYDDDAQGRDFLFGEEIYDRHFGIREEYHLAENDFIATKHQCYKLLAKLA